MCSPPASPHMFHCVDRGRNHNCSSRPRSIHLRRMRRMRMRRRTEKVIQEIRAKGLNVLSSTKYSLVSNYHEKNLPNITYSLKHPLLSLRVSRMLQYFVLFPLKWRPTNLINQIFVQGYVLGIKVCLYKAPAQLIRTWHI